ncbi:MAG UNVERIFIED_CONTAM: hypothetical protein LVT10_07515 [Anaerolineae bacterium]|jgi:anthranilate/para-aminobenzoate synthase component II
MILVIDNYDSFTYNIVQQMGMFGAELCVIRNDEMTPAQVKHLNPSHIIISPGPGRPERLPAFPCPSFRIVGEASRSWGCAGASIHRAGVRGEGCPCGEFDAR